MSTPQPVAPTDDPILTAAAALLDQVGWAGFTYDGWARHARAGKPTLYRRWPTRAHLLIALHKTRTGPLPRPDSGDVAADLGAWLSALLAEWQAGAAQTLRLLVAEAQTSPIARAGLEDERGRWRDGGRILLAAAFRGDLRDGLTPDLAEERLHGVLFLRLMAGQLPRPDQAVELVETTLL